MRVLEGAAARKAVAALANREPVPNAKIEKTVAKIVGDVRRNGDRALRKYAEKFDGLSKGEAVQVTRAELQQAVRSVSKDFIRSVETAAKNIRTFAEWQMPKAWMRTIAPGIRVGQKVEPLDSVGCYAPGGRYPLPSSVLMTAVPAQVAGVRRIQVASPKPANETLAAAAIIGVTEFFRIGGAQAVAAFAYGTESVPKVAKIVGPGNSFVTSAKRQVAFDASIDFLAGPTEIVYVAHKGDPAFAASDLVAQAEHDPETLPIFITSNRKFAEAVAREAERQAKGNAIATESLKKNGVYLVARDRTEAVEWANIIGGEHITVDREDVKAVRSAGSIFVGDYSPQSVGDYASGPNHTLPTGNVARHRGGLCVLDHVKIISIQELTKAGLKRIAPTVTLLAEAEGLKAHATSVRVRLK
jgi:histidinol dehydrogenase